MQPEIPLFDDSESESISDNFSLSELPSDSISTIQDNLTLPMDEDTSLSWMNETVSPLSNVTVGHSVNKLLNMFFRHSVTKSLLNDFLMFINETFTGNNLPKNQYYFLKYLETLQPKSVELIIKHRICEDCLNYVGEFSKTLNHSVCSNCKSSNTRGHTMAVSELYN